MNDKRILELLTRKIAGEISLEELEELNNLFEKNPDIVYYEQYLKEIWQGDIINLGVDIDKQYETHILRHTELIFQENKAFDIKSGEKVRKLFNLNYVLVLGIFIIVGILFFQWNSNLFSEQSEGIINRMEIMTQKGVRKLFLLPDGTKV